MDTDAAWQLHKTEQRLLSVLQWLCCEHGNVCWLHNPGLNGFNSLTRLG